MLVALFAGAHGLVARLSAGPIPERTIEARVDLSGRWHGQLPMGDGRKADLYLDLAMLEGRWIGECDFEAFELVDFTLSVSLTDSIVHLDFGNADASFDGRLVGKPTRIEGVLRSGRGPADLVLSRVGRARLSEELLRFERAAADSTQLLHLSPNGKELRAAFNRERSKARLVVLLSPT